MAASGIYEIVNLVNGKRYVGSAVNIPKRWAEHRRDLDSGKHHCPPLLRAWRKYGAINFAFRVMEECKPSLLIEREQAAFDRLRPEYNVCKTAGSSLGYRHEDTARKNMSESQRRRYDGMTAAEKHALSAHLQTPEMIEKAAAAKRGKKRGPMPEHVKAKLSASKKGRPNFKNRGRPKSEECRRKIREARARQVIPLGWGRSRAKLTDDQVREIRRRRLAGEFCTVIGRDFDLLSSEVSRICLRQRYGWVDPEEGPISFPKKGRGGWKHKLGYRTGRRSRRNEDSQNEPSLFSYRG